MTEFKRLISYLYEYEGKVKGKNVGFVKLETRNGLCKLNVSIRKLYLGSGNLGVYLLSARQEIFLGNLVLRNGGGEFRTTVQAADIEQSGETMDGCYGLSIYEKKDSWKVYTTIWEDSLAKSAQYTSKGDHGNRIEKRARTAEKEEEETLTVHAAELPSIQTAEVMLIPEKETVSLPEAQDNHKTNLGKNGWKNKREITEKNTANGKNRGIGKNIIIGKNAKDGEDANMDEIAEIHANAGIRANIETGTSAEIDAYTEGNTNAEIDVNTETGRNTKIRTNAEINTSVEIGANAELGINAEFNTNAETDGNAEHGTNTEAGGNAEYGANTEADGNAESGSNANVDINAEIRGNTRVSENKKAFNMEKDVNRNETAEENEGRENCPQIEKIINTLSTYESKESKDNKDSRDNKETLIENSQKAAENMNTGKEKSTETMVSSNRPQQGIGNRFPRSRINNYTIPSRRPMGLPRENPSKERPQTESQGFSNHQPINQQPLNRQPVNQQPMNRQFINRQPINQPSINQQPINRQPINQPSMNQQPINRQPINHQSINRQLINQHSINHQPINQQPINQQPLNYQPINQQPLNQQFINHHSVNHQPINQQPVNQQPLNQSAINQQPMNQQPLNQSPVNQQPLSQQPLNHQPVNQQPLEQTSINQQAFIRQQPEEALIVGDPEALAKLEEEENIPPVPLWDFLSKTYPKIQAFESQYGCEILVIKPQDIGLLPREVWVYGNNSFLLHGYYNYRYLILARLENPHGLARYLLGVPGHYYNNEKYMASMFGFPNFVLSKKQQAQDGRFGYWYTDIRLGEQNVAAAVVRRAQTHTQA